MFPLSPRHEQLLMSLAIFGLIVPNGLFIYCSIFNIDRLLETLTNPIALVFVVEAFVLMGLIAWLIHRSDRQSSNWLSFIILSLVGSMMFSVPFTLVRYSRSARALQDRSAS